jgi:hypothetical protein
VQPGTLRSGLGSSLLRAYPEAPHSIFRFLGRTFVGSGNGLYENASLLTLPAALNGDRLQFIRAPRTVGVGDLLYVTGGGKLLNVDANSNVRQWGVAAPKDGTVGKKLAYKVRTLGTCRANAGTIAPGSTGTIELLNLVVPVDCTKFDADGGPSLSGDYLELYVMFDAPQNITTFNVQVWTQPSPTSPIGVFVRSLTVVVDPNVAPSIPATIDARYIAAGASDASALQKFLDSGFTVNDLANQATRLQRQVGTDRNGQPVYEYIEIPKVVVGGQSTIAVTAKVWTQLLIPRNTFIVDNSVSLPPVAFPNTPMWSGVLQVKCYATTTGDGACTVTVGPAPDATMTSYPLRMVGGSPITGTVQYFITFIDPYRDKAGPDGPARLDGHGNESNPNPTYLDTPLGSNPIPGQMSGALAVSCTPTDTTLALVDASLIPDVVPGSLVKIQIDDEIMLYSEKVGDVLTVQRGVDLSLSEVHASGASVRVFTIITVPAVNRHPVELTNLPIPPAGYQLGIYRTMGNQATAFRAAVVDYGDGTWLDDFADFSTIENPPHVLSTTLLRFDNVQPSDSYSSVSDLTWNGRMWWCRDMTTDAGGNRIYGHRLYYSPSGLYESVANFIEITNSEDLAEKAVVFQGQLYVFTHMGIFLIAGTDEPFIPMRVTGCPGTTDRFSVIPTDGGIFYKAKDGIRCFNGASAPLVGFASLAPLFRGESAEDLSAFSPALVAYGRSELWAAATNETLIWSDVYSSWRNLGRVLSSVYYDKETDEMLAAVGLAVWKMDEDNVFQDPDGPIPFEVETLGLSPAIDAPMLLQRIYAAAKLNGQSLTPTLILDGVPDEADPESLVHLEIALPAFTGGNLTRSFEWSVNKTCRVVGIRFDGNLILPVEISRVEADIDTSTIAPLNWRFGNVTEG